MITLSTLRDWQRREKDTPEDLAQPPADFAAEWQVYLGIQRKLEGDEHGIIHNTDAEIYAAMDVLDSILALRREKLARMAEANLHGGTPPTFRHEFEFESNAWFGLTGAYQRLDAAYKELTMGEPAPDPKKRKVPK